MNVSVVTIKFLLSYQKCLFLLWSLSLSQACRFFVKDRISNLIVTSYFSHEPLHNLNIKCLRATASKYGESGREQFEKFKISLIYCIKETLLAKYFQKL